jgi:hypothetical protein
MGGRAEEILPSVFLSPVKRAGVLDIRSPFYGHLSPSAHFQKAGTEDDSFLDGEGSWGSVSAVSGNNGLSFHLDKDIGQDLFGIVVGIPEDTFCREGEIFLGLPEKRNGLLFLVMVRRKSLLMERKL